MPFLAAIFNKNSINKSNSKTDSLHTKKILSPPKDKSDVHIPKRVSLFALKLSRNILKMNNLAGSITIEAALVLPIFIFCICYVMCFTNVVKISGEIGNVLYESGKELAQYAYASGKTLDDSSINEEIEDIALYGIGSVYVESRLSKSFDKNYLRKNGINGISGINLLRSSYMDNDIIDIVATYKASVNCNFFRLPDVPIVLRYRVRAWNGYTDSNGTADSEDTEKMVYITENGGVYHKTTQCTHLKLSISSVSKAKVKKMRNESGGKYYACEICKGDGATVFITATGNRYHSSKGCSGLKRTVIKIPISQINGRAPCSRCG